MSNTLIYEIWKSMRQRCFNPNNRDFHNYGGRGITISQEWNKFETFYKWAIKNGYKEHLTLERINVNGNYEPANCKWIQNEKQALNRRNTKTYELDGKKYSIRELSEKFGINYNTFRDYLQKGKSVDQIINNFN